ncbi:MAG: thermonuclease family protein [Candidatus Bipolaricaulota bacterium]|nr:thermonuclease family protein [Candidatus Bipolaricaulota bacterium]MCS7275335.1 thermonuclease family protein [Candidatus Bipolaricaulota bacterium]MDW8110166.1 thermonuclease family protein [Candidatus Bipolaricaulota bacterium]MDW8329198.1 thermonuclease family protein [Candidatus Bipolaricaulota bacterium]
MPLALEYESHRIQAGVARWMDALDGDTPEIQLTIRLLGIDAPEMHYPGTTKPSAFDRKLERLLETHRAHFRSRGLREHLAPKLADRPGTRQLLWGQRAKNALKQLAVERLHQRAGGQTRYRPLYLTVGEERFDQHRRLLAYVAPEEKNPEKRRTFNLLLMEAGWAVNYILYPNLPKPEDWERLQKAVRQARHEKRGFWEDELLLLGYEFRFCVDTLLGKRTGPDKYCVDITTGILYKPHEYYLVEPENRLFIPKEHLRQARRAIKGLKTR